MSTIERKSNQRKAVNQQSHKDMKRKLEGDGEIKIYSRWIWDGFDGGGGYISERMFGTSDGTQFSFPTEDENGQERMKV